MWQPGKEGAVPHEKHRLFRFRGSFHRHALGEVAGFIDVAFARQGDVIPEKLHGHYLEGGHEQVVCFGM